MTDAINNLKNALSNAGDYIDELEAELEELEEYQSIFEDTDEARDARDYHEEMSDIFEDSYDAQAAKDIADACEWQGWDDVSEVEEAAAELERYRELGDYEEVLDAVRNSDGGVQVADLEKKLADAEATIQKLIELEDMRVRAIRELRGITLEQAEIDQRAAEEQAYEVGLNDGLIIRKQVEHPAGNPSVDFHLSEQGIVDLDTIGDDEA